MVTALSILSPRVVCKSMRVRILSVMANGKLVLIQIWMANPPNIDNAIESGMPQPQRRMNPDTERKSRFVCCELYIIRTIPSPAPTSMIAPILLDAKDILSRPRQLD